MNPIRILIVDDHPVVRRGIVSLLSNHDDLEVVGQAEKVQDALKLLHALRPNVVLLDIRLPGESGLDLLDHIRTVDAKILILTSFDDEEHILEALQGGAHGFILKSVSDEMLCGAIRTVHEGGRVMSPQITERMLHQLTTEPDAQTLDNVHFDEQELRIIHLLVTGDSNDEMAAELYMSVASIKRKLRQIFTKLNVHNRAQAAAVIVQRGIV